MATGNEENQARELERQKKEALLQQQQDLASKNQTKRRQEADLGNIDQNRKNIDYDPNKWKRELRASGKSKKEQLKDAAKAAGKAKQLLSNLKARRQIGPIDGILFLLLITFAVIIDGLSLVTGNSSAVFDWILDIMFFISVFFTVLVATGDPIGSLIGRKTVINIIQTLLEFIPVIELFPFHVLAVIIIMLDTYGYIKFNKKSPKTR